MTSARVTEADARRLREDTGRMDERALLSAVLDRYAGRVVFASSLGAEDQVLTDLLVSLDPSVPIVTLDTGRLPQETHDLIDESRRFFAAEIKVVFPDAPAVEKLVGEKGANLFYESIENRRACCFVRKVAPLKRALAGFDVWMTGMRRAQSPTRAQLDRVEYDEANAMIKLNPLIDWTTEQVWGHLRSRGIPYNALHDRGYPSIGCLPCTRAVQPGEDERAGRWWWERPELKECGIHVAGAVRSSAS